MSPIKRNSSPKQRNSYHANSSAQKTQPKSSSLLVFLSACFLGLFVASQVLQNCSTFNAATSVRNLIIIETKSVEDVMLKIDTSNNSIDDTPTANQYGSNVANEAIHPVMDHLIQSSELIIDEPLEMSSGVTQVSENGDDNNDVTPRAYQPWRSDLPLPCYRAKQDWFMMKIHHTMVKVGFLYLKPYKTGSSTSAGINLRIARNVAKRTTRSDGTSFDMCVSRFDHGQAKLYKGRYIDKSYLWTIIREPTQRMISDFFHFQVSRIGTEPTDENFIRYINSTNKYEDYYLKALYVPKWFDRRAATMNPITVSNDILSEYNFIGITERMDESAVALMMLLNTSMSDILYLSSKKNGGYDDGGDNGCKLIQPSFVSPQMETFFQSERWSNIVRYDRMLYEAANKSLDMTIQQLGYDVFQANLAKFQHALEVAKEKCLPSTVFPCDQWGVFRRRNETDCLWSDSGCGTTCLDTVATELGLW